MRTEYYKVVKDSWTGYIQLNVGIPQTVNIIQIDDQTGKIICDEGTYHFDEHANMFHIVTKRDGTVPGYIDFKRDDVHLSNKQEYLTALGF